MLKIIIIINDLIEKAKIKAYLNIANSKQNYYDFEIAGDFNSSDKAVNFLYENDDIDILILENSASGTYSGIDLILLAEKKFPKLNSILICENGDELNLAEHKINNLSAVLSKMTSSDTFLNSLFMTAVKQQKLKENLEEEKRKLEDYREIIDYTHDAIFLLDVDDNNVYYRRINKTNQKITALSTDQIMGKTPIQIYGEELGAKFLEKYLKCIKEKKKLKFREKISFKTGDIVAETSLYPVIEDNEVKRIIGTSLDITEYYKREEELKYHKIHDQKTNLHNRDFFIEKLNDFNQNIKSPLAISLIDINSYNIYKKLFGVEKSDVLLKKTAKLLNYAAGRNSFTARIGESRFAVLLQKKKDKAESYYKELVDNLKDMTLDSLKFDFASQLFELEEKKENIIYYYDYINEKLSAEIIDNKFSANSVFYKSLVKKIKKGACNTVQHRSSLIELTKKTADYFEIENKQRKEIILLAKLHDIGKISLDVKILKKGEELSRKEWLEYQRYIERSAAFAVEYFDLSNIYNLIYHHHENYNGSGYPDGLQGKKIPYLARLFRIINFYDMLRSNFFYPFLEDKYYFAELNSKEIISEIGKYKGIVFDPEITAQFIKMLEK
ncbi:MAG: HD domain-containing phosphohydrolase [Halanaerobium sp.]